MDLLIATYDRTRNLLHVHGKKYTVKKQRGRFFIHAENKQITVTDIVNKAGDDDPVFAYVFGGLFISHPCPAVDYWIERWRMKRRISITQFKIQNNIKPRSRYISPNFNLP